MRIRIGVLKIHQSLWKRTTEAIYALVFVANHEHITLRSYQQLYQLVLALRGVLCFVHANIGKAARYSANMRGLAFRISKA